VQVRENHPLDEAVARAISPPRSSPQAVKKVREDEEQAPIEAVAVAGGKRR
jgi:hypothetical protein